MTTQEIPWKIGGGNIVVTYDETVSGKVRLLSISSSTPNNGAGRSQEVTVKLTRFPSIQKSFLVYQPGRLSYDGAVASTPDGNYTHNIDCSTADSEFGVLEDDKLYECGDASDDAVAISEDTPNLT